MVQPQQPIVDACKIKYDLCFTISLLSLSSAVKSDPGRMTVTVLIVYKNNIVSNFERLHHSNTCIRFY